jgi:hypothetical protein
MERLTKALVRYETLDRPEIERLIAGTLPEDLRPEAPKGPAEPVGQTPKVVPPQAAQTESKDKPGFSGEAGLSPA